jgi:hypothetical protein
MVGEALGHLLAHCGYDSWQDAWEAHVGGYRRDPDQRVVRGAANLLLLGALCEDEDLAGDDSVFGWLAELGALELAEQALSQRPGPGSARNRPRFDIMVSEHD